MVDYKVYEDYKELMSDDEKLAKELLEGVGKGDWQNDDIFVFDNIERFAEFELVEGWYAGSLDLYNTDFNGAPNPLDHINLKSLGEDLKNTWDDSGHYLSEDERVIQTNVGW